MTRPNECHNGDHETSKAHNRADRLAYFLKIKRKKKLPKEQTLLDVG
jgi:hypothetical protein